MHFVSYVENLSKPEQGNTSAKMCEAYNSYFSMPVGDQDRTWAPHFACDYCKKILEGKSC